MAPPRSRRFSGRSLPAEPAVGDRVVGRVVDLAGDGTALMDIGGRPARADIRFAVNQGDLLRLEVIDTGPPLHLRALPSDEPSIGAGGDRLLPWPPLDVRKAMAILERLSAADPEGAPTPQSTDLAAANRILSTLLKPLSLDAPVPELARAIADKVSGSGLFTGERNAGTRALVEGAARQSVGRASVSVEDLNDALALLERAVTGGGVAGNSGKTMKASIARVMTGIRRYHQLLATPPDTASRPMTYRPGAGIGNRVPLPASDPGPGTGPAFLPMPGAPHEAGRGSASRPAPAPPETSALPVSETSPPLVTGADADPGLHIDPPSSDPIDAEMVSPHRPPDDSPAESFGFRFSTDSQDLGSETPMPKRLLSVLRDLHLRDTEIHRFRATLRESMPAVQEKGETGTIARHRLVARIREFAARHHRPLTPETESALDRLAESDSGPSTSPPKEFSLPDPESARSEPVAPESTNESPNGLKTKTPMPTHSRSIQSEGAAPEASKPTPQAGKPAPSPVPSNSEPPGPVGAKPAATTFGVSKSEAPTPPREATTSEPMDTAPAQSPPPAATHSASRSPSVPLPQPGGPAPLPFEDLARVFDAMDTETERMVQENDGLRDRVRDSLSQLTAPVRSGMGDRSAPPGLLPVPFAIALDHHQSEVRLQVFYPKKRRSGSGSRRQISLFLNLDRLDGVQADVVLDGSNLGICFRVSRPDVRAHLETHFPDLFERLTGLFGNVSLAAALDRPPDRSGAEPVWDPMADTRQINVSA